MISRLQLVLVD